MTYLRLIRHTNLIQCIMYSPFFISNWPISAHSVLLLSYPLSFGHILVPEEGLVFATAISRNIKYYKCVYVFHAEQQKQY